MTLPNLTDPSWNLAYAQLASFTCSRPNATSYILQPASPSACK